ncbi:hypothetical protein CYLTODRAFT_462105 [Cylindrobasidium torrendii FP15055 ss-10]|uniref:Uncharacterized protein n=1 Tax=Cylindrobasidium torrendii FP15055 ss-10 TaxID=1314674 RepID=A0A0D7B9W1_9AGAR|nr:hypothetical protein CYLTODRAFT_462105 [Cylindrobasidium torrendii FP15055 ss-10]
MILSSLLVVPLAFPSVFGKLTAGIPGGVLLPRNDTSYLDSLSDNQRELFNYAMTGLDMNFAPPFIFESTRYSAWYAVGLLARNEGDDLAVASQIIQDVISFQYTDPNDLWFGTYQGETTAPTPGDVYAPKECPQAYTSYDLNMGLFVCTSFIIALEEFSNILDPDLVDLMKRSMYNATIGDGYRVGGVDGDNLYPIYSNPWYMRVMSATYVGNMMGDANMSYWGDHWANEAIQAFDKYSTISEFNSGTYTGVSLYALSLWGYMPESSVISSRAADIITKTWETVGQIYNPTLHTLGGPWDRTYGYDLRRYFGILGGHIAGLLGGIADGSAPIPRPLVGCSHYGDAVILALMPLTAKFHDPYVPASVIESLKSLSGPHAYFAQSVSPPFDDEAYPRNYTTWTQDGLSVGGIESDENVVGGPATSQTAYVPASFIWKTDVPEAKDRGRLAWMFHHPTASSISAVVSSTNLTIKYPPSRAFPEHSTTSNIMSFLFSGVYKTTLTQDFLANGTAVYSGLKLTVSGNVASGNRTLVYGQDAINEVSFYNLTYTIPDDLGDEVPTLIWEFEKL